ncbi:hypothetical protein BH09PAT2_BH09PAT2_03040 [soil metagenome]
MTPTIEKTKDKLIIYPTSSYLLGLSVIGLVFIFFVIRFVFYIYYGNMETYAASFFIIVGISAATFCFSQSLSRKIIVSKDTIQNVRGFPYRSQIIYKNDIIDHTMFTSESFAGGKAGARRQSIDFIGKDGKTFSTWSVEGFQLSDLEKIFRDND